MEKYGQGTRQYLLERLNCNLLQKRAYEWNDRKVVVQIDLPNCLSTGNIGRGIVEQIANREE